VGYVAAEALARDTGSNVFEARLHLDPAGHPEVDGRLIFDNLKDACGKEINGEPAGSYGGVVRGPEYVPCAHPHARGLRIDERVATGGSADELPVPGDKDYLTPGVALQMEHLYKQNLNKYMVLPSTKSHSQNAVSMLTALTGKSRDFFFPDQVRLDFEKHKKKA